MTMVLNTKFLAKICIEELFVVLFFFAIYGKFLRGCHSAAQDGLEITL